MKVAEYLANERPALSLRYSEIPGTQATMATVLRRIREEVTGAVRGVVPAGTKFSIRCEHRSVTVEIVAWHAPVFSSNYMDHVIETHVRAAEAELRNGPYVVGATTPLASYTQREELHEGLAQALHDIEAIANRHNYRHSDPHADFDDVGYYLNVNASTVIAHAYRGVKLEADPRFATLLATATAAARRVGAKVVRSVLGREGLEAAGEYELTRLIQLDARASGRPLVWCKQRSAWIVDDTQAVAS